MKCRNYLIPLFCLCALLMSSCSGSDDNPWDRPDTEDGASQIPEEEDEEEYTDPGDETLIPNSQTLSLDNMISIAFSTAGVEISNPFESQGVAVTNNNGHVTINSTITDKELNYVLSGITADGSVKIYGEYKFNLHLNGVGITNPKGAAINIQCPKKITVTVVNQSRNRLVDGATYEYVTDEDMKGTFFSEGQLNFYGTGSLEVRGKNKHAICTDDYFRMYEGNIWVKEAVSDAIHAKDYVKIHGGNILTRSAGDAIDCDGYIEIDGGLIDITTTDKKGHGLKSGDYITIGGSSTVLEVSVQGIASKAINATGDLTISEGTLTLKTTGDAYYDTDDADTSSAAAIKCDANTVIDGGTITIKSTGSGGKGINVGGTLTINDGVLSITTTGDQYVYDKNNDTAAKAMKSDGNLTINGGKITVKTYRTEAEGIESKATLTIAGGDVEVEAYDDCLNASNHIQIDGGRVYCSSTTNDGIDSNGTLTITGGIVISAGASSPEAGIDCDQSRFAISGGTLIGIGGDTSTPTASACTNYSLVYRSTGAKTVCIQETSGGTEVITFQLPKTYNQSMTMLVSTPLLKASTGYTIYTGGSITGGTDFHGLYTGATYSGGSSAATFTTSGKVTTVGNNPGGGRP